MLRGGSGGVVGRIVKGEKISVLYAEGYAQEPAKFERD